MANNALVVHKIGKYTIKDIEEASNLLTRSIDRLAIFDQEAICEKCGVVHRSDFAGYKLLSTLKAVQTRMDKVLDHPYIRN